MWLDRRAANRDRDIFPYPDRFDLENVRAITRPGDRSVLSVFSHSRYEIKSFSMINTDRNPRKCPGRYFTVLALVGIMRVLYGKYTVIASSITVEPRRFSPMPRPIAGAMIRFSEAKSTHF